MFILCIYEIDFVELLLNRSLPIAFVDVMLLGHDNLIMVTAVFYRHDDGRRIELKHDLYALCLGLIVTKRKLLIKRHRQCMSETLKVGVFSVKMLKQEARARRSM